MKLPSFKLERYFFRIGFGRKNMPEALGKLEEYLIRG